MSDFVERCRTARYSSNDVREAADEIIRLREKNSRLLAANKDLQAWFDDARDECGALRKRLAQYEALWPGALA